MDTLLKKFDIEVSNKELLTQALTHSSYGNEKSVENYERLEFLGDAVLQLIVTNFLFENFDIKEGDLTKKRATYVCEDALYVYAKELKLQNHILVSKGTIISKSIIADVLEALIAVIYLDKGEEEVLKLLDVIIFQKVLNNEVDFTDYKSLLQEYVQSTKKSLKYNLLDKSGPDHKRVFTSEVIMDGVVLGTGIGSTIKQSEQEAAKVALSKMGK